MKIILTEIQVKKLLLEANNNEECAYDFFDARSEKTYNVLESIKNKQQYRINKINPLQYKKALEEFVKYGKFIRFPEKYIYQWKGIMFGNTALLEGLNNLFGASQGGFPHDEFYEVFDIPEDERNYDFFEDYEKLDEIYNLDNYIPYFSNGQPVMSDYGLRPLVNLCVDLCEAKTPEEIIVVINKMLDVTHQRSDLSEIFIQGGGGSLDMIFNNMSNTEELNENIQLADKYYFQTGLLDDQDKDFILSITGGDNLTKIISDIYFKYKDLFWMIKDVKKNLPKIYNQIKQYDKNVFPIEDFNIYNPKNFDFYPELKNRGEIITNIKKLPSVAIRNLKNEIRQPRTSTQLQLYNEDLQYFIDIVSFLDNRDKKVKEKILNKLYKSNITIKKLIDFVDDKENLIGGNDFTKEDILRIIKDEDYLDLIYDNNNVMVVRVESAEAIKKIGCNSLWCFTYGENNYRMWDDYSYHGMVYVIIDLNSPSDSFEFMHVLIKPLKPKYNEDDDEYPLHNMGNDNFYDPYSVLIPLLKNKITIKKLFTFDY